MRRRTTGFSEWVRMVMLLAAALVGSALPAYGAERGGPSAQTFPGELGDIAFTGRGVEQLDIFRIDIDGSDRTDITSTSRADSSQPAWSAEGTRIAFVSSRDIIIPEIYVMTATGGHPTRLTNNFIADVEPSWFPSDARIAFRRGVGANPQTQADIYALALDDNANPVGTEVQLTTNPANDIMPAVSPDGKRIAFASDRDGDYEIYVMKAAPEGPKNKPIRLTNNAAIDQDPDWSPDGKRIAFDSDRDGDAEIFVMNADGTKQKNLTQNSAVTDIDPTWSPDGKRIAFERDGGGVTRDIFRMRADGTRPFNLTDNAEVDANPAWQPR